MSDYKIIYDTAEKKPFQLEFFGKETAKGNLQTGDYTIEGHEDLIAIERKASASELAMNLGSKWFNFRKEMERLSDFDFKCILCEFPYEQLAEYPKHEKPQLRRKARINGAYLISKIQEIEIGYDVPTIFCNNRHEAEVKIIEIFDEYIRNVQKNNC